jgi:hypothetical protein
LGLTYVAQHEAGAFGGEATPASQSAIQSNLCKASRALAVWFARKPYLPLLIVLQPASNMSLNAVARPKNSVEETFRWEISTTQLIKCEKRITSPTFGPADSPWKLSVVKEGDAFSVYLYAIPTTVESRTKLARYVTYLFQINPTEEKNGSWRLSLPESQVVTSFTNENPAWGRRALISETDYKGKRILVILAKVSWERPFRMGAGLLNPTQLTPSSDFADAEFHCAGELDNPIPAHRFILSQQMVTFRTLFRNTNAEVRGGRVVIRTDFPRETILSFLDYSYSGNFVSYFPESAVDRKRLLKAAAKYQHTHLADSVGHLIVRMDLTVSTFTALMTFAWANKISSPLREGCVTFFKDNLEMIGKQKNFAVWVKEAPSDLVVELFV